VKTDRTRTVDVVTAGKILGIGRSSSYRLAHRGILPVLRLGRKLRVPVAALEEMLSNPKPLGQQAVSKRRRRRRAVVETLAPERQQAEGDGAVR